MSTDADLLQLNIHSLQRQALRVISYDLRPVDGRPIPEFEAGAHLDLVLPNGLSRSYSLVNSQSERHRYVIAVGLDENTRGGSEFIHKNLNVGDVVQVRRPRNNFALIEDAPHTVFVAGGIGITPILCMARRLQELGRSWHLLYCARTRAHASMLTEIASIAGGSRTVDLRFNEESGYRAPDLGELVARAAPGTHFYACGPNSLTELFLAAAGSVPSHRVHKESFIGVEPDSLLLGGFELKLDRAGATINVAPGQTILAALRAAGFDPPASCEEGTCGACEVAVIDGVPLHRDQVLSDDDKAEGFVMMICCSGSKTGSLTIDL